MLNRFYQVYIRPCLPYLHWILLFLGALLLIFSYTFPSVFEVSFFGTDRDYSGLAKAISVAIFSSGLFAAVAKSHQLLGLFLEDIEKTIHSSTHYNVRMDKDDLWRRAMLAFHQGAFPEIDGKIVNYIQSKTAPHNHNYYFKRAVRKIDISWRDSNNGNIIKVVTHFSGTIVPRNGIRNLKLKTVLDDSNELSRDDLERQTLLTVNGKGISLSNFSVRKVDEGYQHELMFSLEVEQSIVFSRRDTRYQDISVDSVIQFAALSYIDGLTVEVVFQEGLEVVFNANGVDTFDRVHSLITNEEERARRNIQRKFDGLLLADQGYILTVSRSV